VEYRDSDRDDEGASARDRRRSVNFGARFTNDENGLTVSGVNRGTLAAQIGLRTRDEVISVGGRRVLSPDQLNQILMQSRSTDQRIPIVVRREGEQTTLYVQPQTLRETFFRSSQQFAPDLGVVLVPGEDERLIVQDVRGGLARAIGFRENDILLSVGGRNFRSPAEFRTFIQDIDLAAGRRLPVIVFRDGRRVTLYLDADDLGGQRIGRYRSFDGGGEGWLGVVMDGRYRNAVVREVVPDSPADYAGLRQGDSILRINGRRIDSPSRLTAIVESMNPGDEVEIEIARRVTRTVSATLDRQEDSRSWRVLRPYDGGQVDSERRYRSTERIDESDPDWDRRGLRDRFGPDERGIRDRLDRDEIPDAPRQLRQP
jgi:S1-C subfamily serine protease